MYLYSELYRILSYVSCTSFSMWRLPTLQIYPAFIRPLSCDSFDNVITSNFKISEWESKWFGPTPLKHTAGIRVYWVFITQALYLKMCICTVFDHETHFPNQNCTCCQIWRLSKMAIHNGSFLFEHSVCIIWWYTPYSINGQLLYTCSILFCRITG